MTFCLRNGNACARRCRVERCYTTPLLLLPAVAQPLAALLPYGCGTPCGCCSAYLVEVRSNQPEHSSMRRAQQCRYFASSLPPSKRHSRLTTVRRGCCQVATRRDSWRSHVHHTHTAQRVQPFKLQTANAGVEGALPSLGDSRGYSLRKENTPFLHRGAHAALPRAYAGKGAALSGYPSLRAAREAPAPLREKKKAPLRVLFFKSLKLAEQGHQDACGDSGTDNTCNVRAHGVHEQEVGGGSPSGRRPEKHGRP